MTDLLRAVPGLSTAPDWVISLILFAAILIVAVAVQHLVMPAIRRRAKAWPPLLQAVLRRTHAIGRVAFVVLAINVAFPILPLPADIRVGIRQALGAVDILLVGWMVVIAMNIAADHYIGGFKLDSADNLMARKAVTQARVLRRALGVVIGVITVGLALMTFDAVREVGVSIFASAGIAGILVGLAAQQFLANLLAGIQLAITQPLRLEDVVVINGEFGWVEEIRSTYVVIRLWDWRRMVVPLKYLFDNPFQNWTRQSSAILSNFYIYLDYTAPIDVLRAKVGEFAAKSKNWDKNIVNLQVTDFTEHVMQVRILLSAENAGKAWDVRADVREMLVSYIQHELPQALPKWRSESAVTAEVAAPKESRPPLLRAVSTMPESARKEEPSGTS